MKFTKGVIIGSMLTAGIIMMVKDNTLDAKEMVKKGKRFIKKIM